MKKLNVYLKDHYLKIIVGFLASLIVFEWINGVRSNFQMDKLTSAFVPPILKKAPPASKKNMALKAHLFGDYLPNDIGTVNIKRSTLNMTVVGILFVADDEKKSHVMLELPGHEVKLFRLEDTIPGGAVIKRITSEGILVMHHGVMERLSLPKNEVFFSPPAPSLTPN